MINTKLFDLCLPNILHSIDEGFEAVNKPNGVGGGGFEGGFGY